MNVRELRIGNLIMTSKPEQVCDVMCDSVSTMSGTYTLDEIEPIPLTEEWLLSFGFQKDKDGVCTKLGVLFWLESGRLQIADGYTSLINCPCAYVHQLQNLYFALTGNELELK